MSSFNKTAVFKVDPARPSRKAILSCAKLIRAGMVVAFPTETVYGLAADMSNHHAVEKLYRVKGRPRNKPFTVHIADIRMVKKMGCSLSASAKTLADRFWPGPLTIILRSLAGRNVGFRMPANKVALELIKAAAVAVVAPSANLSGRKAPTSARGVLDQLDGKIDAVLDAGRTLVGIESTVVDMTKKRPAILRAGAIKKREIIAALKYE